ncbi:unnamed protein product [Oppiella nova]|uniref:Uncharacterized protein n=1 Tax=Oppiella nova TaxID=334625 RepID=A0A7R9MWC6_9ACAR|nr:unnamed protein product [Oppiella nova]CAG2184160.1 unnamed protein product [Oppiella nova]
MTKLYPTKTLKMPRK